MPSYRVRVPFNVISEYMVEAESEEAATEKVKEAFKKGTLDPNSTWGAGPELDNNETNMIDSKIECHQESW